MKEPPPKGKKLKKSEIQNIINLGWEARQARREARREKNSEYTKRWKEIEALCIKYGIPPARARRERHYITTPELTAIQLSGLKDATCVIGKDRYNQQYIYCKICKLSSYNPNDIENKYCAACHRFHKAFT